MNKPSKVSTVQAALVAIVGGGFILSLITMVILSASGALGTQAQEIWALFMSGILPTVGLAVPTLRKPKGPRTVPKLIARTTIVASSIYVALVLGTVFWLPHASVKVTWLRMSSLWLGPVQGLLGGVLGTFLSAQRGASNSPPGRRSASR